MLLPTQVAVADIELRGGKALILDSGGAWDTWADTGPLNPSPMGEGSPCDIALAAAECACGDKGLAEGDSGLWSGVLGALEPRPRGLDIAGPAVWGC